MKNSKGGLRPLLFALLLLLPVLVFLAYTGDYAPAGAEARQALVSDALVTVRPTDCGWFFDGPGTEETLIFYPGGKVEETAYAPLLHQLAAGGLDVCLVRMPLRLAFFGVNRAERVRRTLSCPHVYLGGHSLGGAMAAVYAAEHGEELDGLVLLAAYPTKPLDGLPLLTVYGSEDGVLDAGKLAAGRRFYPADAREVELPGGNHAQFGDYGPQAGDGTAGVSAAEQRAQTAALILDWAA